MVGSLDRQSDCRYRARTAVRLAAGGKQALASLTSLRLAGHASIAAALRFHAAAQMAHCKGHEVLNGFGRPPALPCCRLLPAAEGHVGDAAGAVHGLDLEAVFERLQPVPEPFPAAQHDGHHDDVQVVDQAGR
jgi:hypothetical protein